MTDLEISKALALAIGWKKVIPNGLHCVWVMEGIRCYYFDYRDWNVAGPIAEKFDCFPCTGSEGWLCGNGNAVWADTPQKAIAMAVIGAKK